MKMFYKSRYSLVLLLVLSLVTQIVAPVVGNYAYAEEEEVFKVTSIMNKDGTATVNWEYEYVPGGVLQDELKLDIILEKEQSGELEAIEGVIGGYKINKDGEMTVDISQEKINELLNNQKESTIPLTPLEPSTSIQEDDGNGEQKETEKADEPDSEEGTGEASTEPESENEKNRKKDETSIESEIEEETSNESKNEDDSVRIIESLLGVFTKNVVYAEENNELASYIFKGSFEVEGVREQKVAQESISIFNTGKDLGNIFTNVKILLDNIEIVDGQTIEIVDGMKLKAEFDWELDNTVDLVSGDYSITNLPTQIQLLRDEEGDLLDENNDAVGRFYLNKADKTLKVVFNDELLNKVDRFGKVWVQFDFDLSKFEDDTNQEVVFDTEPAKSFKVKLKPKDGATIIKTGKADKDLNASKITWILDVNTNLETIENATVKDELPEGLALENIEIYNLTVGYNGKLTLGTKLREQGSFPVDLGSIDSAYRIIYTTNITDLSKTEFTNDANISGTGVDVSDNDTVETPRGSTIDKLDGVPDNILNAENITWKIQANIAEGSINGAKIKDTIVENLTLLKDTIKVYNLVVETDGSKTRGTEITPADYSYDETSKELVINLGDIDSAYEIEYITDIVYNEPEDYGKEITFDNTAILTGRDSAGSDVEIGRDSSKALVQKGDIVTKGGESIIEPATKTIDWTIDVNEAEDTIYDVWIEDKLGPGIEFVDGSIVVKDKAGDTLSQGTDYTIESGDDRNDGKGQYDFKVILAGKRTSSYTVEYTTRITDFNRTKFTNAARVSWIPAGENGDGTGPGGPLERIYKEIESEANADIVDTYNKTGKGINYKEKTMDWRIDLGFYKGLTTNLVIEDTFPNNGLVFLENNDFTIIHKIDDRTDTLVKGTDYTVGYRDESSSYGEGFRITFNGEYEDSEIIIKYSTSFDPDNAEFIENETKKYKNNANITGYRFYDGPPERINVNRSATQTIKKLAYDNGEKKGKLNRDERTISWDVYVNYMSKDLKTADFVITDELSEGQSFDSSSFTVSKYEVKENGSYKIVGDPIDSTDYSLKPNTDGSRFTLTFSGGIDGPYVVQFKTNIEGISKAEYTNKAVVTGGKDLEAKVKYPDYNSFLIKETTNVEGGRVWLDDQIDWKLTINNSGSDIYSGATIVDKISKGLVYVNDSLTISKQDGTPLDSSEYTVATEADGEDTKLTITFLNEINERYTVEYSAVVVSQAGTVKNKANFNGKGAEGKIEDGVDLKVKQSSGGTGSGREKKGSIVINKVDDKGESITAEAEFKVYYMLNGEKRIVGGAGNTFKTDRDGQIKIYDLSFRTYFIEEVTAPNGFEFDPDESPIEVEVNRKAEKDNSGAYAVDIENRNIKTQVRGNKEWVGGPSPRPTIELQLYRNGEVLGDSVELVDGKTSYTWKDLDKTDNAGVDYQYTVDEVETPENYGKEILDTDKLTIRNIYESPKTQVTGRKIWDGGSTPRPSIEIQLYRDGEAFGNPVEFKDEETEYTWTDLDRTDKDGKTYVYTIDEVRVPSGYRKIISTDGLTITNMYSPYVPPVDPEPTPDPRPSRPRPEQPVEEITIVLDPPAMGDVTIDENGDWTYTPNPGATGKDEFVIVYPDGSEELIEIDLDDLPLGTTSVKDGQPIISKVEEEKDDQPLLPKTGDKGKVGFYMAGMMLIGLGVFLRRKRSA